MHGIWQAFLMSFLGLYLKVTDFSHHPSIFLQNGFFGRKCWSSEKFVCEKNLKECQMLISCISRGLFTYWLFNSIPYLITLETCMSVESFSGKKISCNLGFKISSLCRKVRSMHWVTKFALFCLFLFSDLLGTTNFDDLSEKPPISITVFQNFHSYFIISKRNEPAKWLEIFAEYSANRRKIREVFKKSNWLFEGKIKYYRKSAATQTEIRGFAP